MKKITGGIDIEGIKRCYVHNAVISIRCPNCKDILVHDFSNSYLSYPVVGEESTCYFCCERCEIEDAENYEFEIPITVRSASVVIEYDESKISVA